MNRSAQGVVLLLVGGVVLKISMTGQYLRYVKPWLLPFLLAAGVVLVILAAATLWSEVVRRGTQEAGHDHAEPAVSWLLVLPVLGLLLIAPPALGSDAANRSGTALTAAEESDYPPLPEGDPVKLSVLDYAARAVFDEGRTLRDRKVLLSGFIVVGADGERYLARMILICCAADARPIKVGLAGQVPANLKADTWVEVEGRYTDRTVEDTVNGGKIPYVEAEAVRLVEAPRNQYE